MLGKDRMIDGLLLESFLTGFARIIAPSMAGFLIAHYGALGCYGAMAILSICAVAVLIPLVRGQGAREAQPFRMASLPVVSEGMRYVRANQAVLAVVLITLAMNMWIFPYVSLLPVFARDILHKGPIELGFLSTGTGMGSFCGLFMLSYLRQRVSVGALFAVGSCWICLSLAAFALSHVYALSWAMLFCAGFGMAGFGTLQSTIVLLSTSDAMRSRVMGIVVLAIGGDPLGQLQFGTLAEHFGVQAALGGLASVAFLAVVLIVVLLPGVLRPAVSDG
jgi:predicted MFS family arabinose efflux permease